MNRGVCEGDCKGNTDIFYRNNKGGASSAAVLEAAAACTPTIPFNNCSLCRNGHGLGSCVCTHIRCRVRLLPYSRRNALGIHNRAPVFPPVHLRVVLTHPSIILTICEDITGNVILAAGILAENLLGDGVLPTRNLVDISVNIVCCCVQHVDVRAVNIVGGGLLRRWEGRTDGGSNVDTAGAAARTILTILHG